MALLYMDSFDHYATADILERWLSSGTSSASISINTTSGRHSSGALRFSVNANSNSVVYVLRNLNPVPGDATVIVGFSFTLSSLAVNGSIGYALLVIRDTAGAQITLRMQSSGVLTVLRGTHNAGTSLGATAAGVLTTASCYIELKVLIHPSAGTVDLRVNGTSVLSLTGQNTRNTANSAWSIIQLGTDVSQVNTSSGAGTMDFDDLYVLDGTGSAPWNDFLGDVRVDYRNPTGAGATTGWTPSTGSNFQNVEDATPNDDTDYNSTTSVATDTFVVQDTPVAGATIYGVQTVMSAKKTDAGSASVAPIVRHSSTDNVGTNVAPSTAYAYSTQMYQLNPGTAAAWTESEFNAAEFGYKKTV